MWKDHRSNTKIKNWNRWKDDLNCLTLSVIIFVHICMFSKVVFFAFLLFSLLLCFILKCDLKCEVYLRACSCRLHFLCLCSKGNKLWLNLKLLKTDCDIYKTNDSCVWFEARKKPVTTKILILESNPRSSIANQTLPSTLFWTAKKRYVYLLLFRFFICLFIYLFE